MCWQVEKRECALHFAASHIALPLELLGELFLVIVQQGGVRDDDEGDAHSQHVEDRTGT